ncbi:MAG: hypothetical protein LLF96_01135 [Eubacteriales bacterium]|nr:hypothetical protein [Eubacteriales bacterium]
MQHHLNRLKNLNAGASHAIAGQAAQSGAAVMKKDETIADGQGFVVDYEAVSQANEDSFTAETDALGGFLCVADGCGGGGSRRYEKLAYRTEAYYAARIAVDCARAWAAPFHGIPLPADEREARPHAEHLADDLRRRLGEFQTLHREDAPSHILVNRLNRPLPTTLCTALIDARDTGSLSAVFFWAGDSRGYVLSPTGLRQCTADHLSGRLDAMENLYQDARLSNLVSADGNFTLDCFGLTLPKPCVVLTATDGAFGYLPTPMEFELLLLQTLRKSASLHSWQMRLQNALKRVAGDDGTLALACYGVQTFAQLQAFFAPRRAQLQADFVTPVRRRRQNPAFARSLWEEYRKDYQLCEEGRHADWRL